MNTSAIRVWYENGSVDEVHLPDPAFENGVAIQREFVDFSDPDAGIFVERSYIDDQVGDDVAAGAYRVLTERAMVVAPEELSHALLVQCHGVEVLRREAWAKTACNLAVTAQAELGFSPSAVDAEATWLSEALVTVASKLHALGERGDAIVADAVRAAVDGDGGR